MAEPVQALKINNHDVVILADQLARFIEELYKSVSSGLSLVNTFDQARWQQYITNIRALHTHIISQPQLDLPETHPWQWAVEPLVNLGFEDTENDSINQAVRLFLLAREELLNSQLARMPAGLIIYDPSRFVSIISKAESFLINYVATATPLDFPESSPQEPETGPGRTGSMSGGVAPFNPIAVTRG